MCVNTIRNVMRHPMPAEEKRQRRKVPNSYSAVILRPFFSVFFRNCEISFGCGVFWLKEVVDFDDLLLTRELDVGVEV